MQKLEIRKKFKVVVIGCGNVGATAAYAMLLDGVADELVLIDMALEKVNGLLLDFNHALAFLPFVKIKATNDYAEIHGADLVIITAGARQKEGESRLKLIGRNREIFKSIVPAVAKYAKQSIILVVSNPVDILTLEALKLSDFPANRVFGTGTMLDSARFRFHLGKTVGVNPKSINAFILGEHGDSSFPVLSSANVAGRNLIGFNGLTFDTALKCYEDTKNAAYRIIHDIGYTCYTIAIVIREIAKAIYQDSGEVMPLSVQLNGQYGISDVALSLPCVIGAEGIRKILEIPLNDEEIQSLWKSAKVIKEVSLV